jgi:catechol 2,3-dioxygenase-like lactoylglutathione lyase family enzyme
MIHVKDIDTSIAFYKQLGFKIVDTHDCKPLHAERRTLHERFRRISSAGDSLVRCRAEELGETSRRTHASDLTQP